MNKLIELSGELRASAIMMAARECVANGERVTPATLRARLPEARFPNLGEIGEDEAEAAFAIIEAEAEQHAATFEAEQPAEQQAAPQADTPQPEAPTMPPAEAVENLRLASVALANARAAVTTATNLRNRARERLASAVQAWQTGMPRMTRDQAAREVIATYQATRAEQVRSIQPGPSVIDRVAANQRGGPAAWGNFRRGASTVRGAPNFDPRKGPVAKLPSQR
ncbi:MAG TPA: hypothetical protein VL048_05865 [Xanthobacteraceae bacterium]|nr:hypothetical protein [Xanthobacteraceae bacterium]